MRHKASRAIFDYWNEIKGGRPAPLRSAIDPTALRNLLPHLFIVTTDEDGDVLFRLAGTRFCEIFDREFRGTGFAEAWFESERRRPIEIVHNVIHEERPALLDVFASNGETNHAYEMLLLPVRPKLGEKSDRVLGALLPHVSPITASDLPVIGLALDNWSFLSGEDPHPDTAFPADRGIFSDALRRLVASRLFPGNRAL